MTTYHWSDPHFDHANIIDFCERPFADTDEMNAKLVEAVNALVSPDDLLICHGDVAMADRVKSLAWLDQILCRNRVLLPGNHDHCWPGGKRNWREWMALYEQYFEVRLEEYPGAGYEHTLEDGTEVLLSHFPYVGDHTDQDRYSAHRPYDDGVPLLHGHVHDAWKVARSPKGTLMINVGVDVFEYMPVSEHTLADLIKENQDT